MGFLDFGRLIAGRWKLLAVSVCSALAAAIVVDVAAPKHFRATASVVVDPRGIDPVSGAATQQAPAESFVVGTIANIARSEGIARKVASDLPESDRRFYENSTRSSERGSVNPTSAVARQLIKGLDVRPGGQNSNVLDISITEMTPDRAARIANDFAHAVMDYAANMRIEPARENESYFDTQAKALREDVVSAEAKLAEFQREHRIIGADDQLDAETTRLNELTSQLTASQAQQMEKSARASQASGESGLSPDIMSSPTVQALKAEVARQERRVQELTSRLGPNHPDLIVAEDALRQARASLARETQHAADSVSVESGISSQKTKLLREAMEELRSKVADDESQRVTLDELKRDAALARKAYDQAIDRRNASNLDAHSDYSDIHLLTEATPPVRPTRPTLTVMLPLAMILGLGAGILFALVQERVGPRVWSTADVAALSFPVMTRVPKATVQSVPRKRLLLNSAVAASRALSENSEKLPIGQMLINSGRLNATRITEIVSKQAETGLPFGAAAVALGLVSDADVQYALAEQFGVLDLQSSSRGLSAELVSVHDASGAVAEAIRGLRSELMLHWRTQEQDMGRAVAVVGPDRYDGRSFIAANLAISFAQAGARTMLVDADLRHGRIQKLFGLDHGVGGLASVLIGRMHIDQAVKIGASETLRVLPAGPVPPNPQELLLGKRFSYAIAALRSRYDVVIVDTPAWTTGADAQTVCAVVGAALLLTRPGHTRLAALNEVVKGLHRARVRIIGTLASRVPT